MLANTDVWYETIFHVHQLCRQYFIIIFLFNTVHFRLKVGSVTYFKAPWAIPVLTNQRVLALLAFLTFHCFRSTFSVLISTS
ncbi:Uncharacterised protein [Vibrio cholerae]|nr:Uncharacterised protein [Vibrio cholerae]CSB42716.1 Uncharacterised protein [Vibrio cholerae]CSD60461.1 Uncharacterised protein [Vibrio cholerae]CSI74907.1 Uncharacterised protein [Vibrio cholerae]